MNRGKEILLPSRVVELCGLATHHGMQGSIPWQRRKESSLWRELCFCILSAHSRYESASKALQTLRSRGTLERLRLNPNQVQSSEVDAQIFPRLTRDRVVRRRAPRYRFHRAKSRQLIQAAKCVYGSGETSGLKHIMTDAGSQTEARTVIAAKVPGLGLKEASHFLRNVGFGNQLAILDIHVQRFVQQVVPLRGSRIPIGGRADYETMERQLLDLAMQYGLELSILDEAIWSYMRAS